MRAAAFCAWFVPLFLLYIVLVFGYNAVKIQHRAAAQRKARQEQERIAAERRAKDEARKREQQAEKARKAAEAAAVKAAKEEERRQKAAEKARKAAEAAERRRIAEERRQEREAEKARKAEAQAAKPAKTQRAQAIPGSALPSGAQPFAGEVVAFTGKCPKMTRRHMIEHVNRLGGRGYDEINAHCTLLVVGENPGKGQMDKAARWNKPTITWEEWWERAFGFPAVTKPETEAEEKPEAEAQPEKEAESILTMDQFAAIVEHAA